MFGLALQQGETALFVTTAIARTASIRLSVIATRGCKTVVRPVYRRSSLVGYRVTAFKGGEAHVITEPDVERFGL